MFCCRSLVVLVVVLVVVVAVICYLLHRCFASACCSPFGDESRCLRNIVSVWIDIRYRGVASTGVFVFVFVLWSSRSSATLFSGFERGCLVCVSFALILIF